MIFPPSVKSLPSSPDPNIYSLGIWKESETGRRRRDKEREGEIETERARYEY